MKLKKIFFKKINLKKIKVKPSLFFKPVTLVIKPGYPIESKPKKIMKQNSQTSKIKKK
jgi:hypothetical protein